MMNLKFEEFALSDEMLKAIKKMGFEEASPIQSKTIGLILEGKDVVGQAHTGTGKTAAFGIPALEKIDHNSKRLQLIILCPTRELVLQVAQEIKNLAKYKEKINIVPVYGGQQIETQLKALKKGAQVVVGTPGRTMDHLRRGSIDISTIKTVVLDEADEMLDMGFREDIETILKDSPKERQTIMFSATMEKDILRLTKNYQRNPVIVNVISEKANPLRIQQVYFEVLNKNKPELVSRLIDLHNIKLCLIFCNTKSQVDELVETLKTRGYFADGLHGDMNQNQREKIMRSFRSGSTEILVATDVAGRGIDVNDVEAVINYDLPRDDEDYTHRIGRTGRAGKKGKAFTFVSGKQIYNLKRIEKSNGALITRQNIPTLTELETIKINKISDEIKTVIEESHLSSFVNHVEMIMGDECTSIDVAAALLKIMLEKEAENFDENVNFEEFEKVDLPKKNKGGYKKHFNHNKKKDNNYNDFSGNKNKSRKYKRDVDKKSFLNSKKNKKKG
ncbi:MAG: DEAD/DEAH box helicase [Candidatus Gastranaerophilales bacterium]|nr:DEAD/DEAH box helicase [Candidatus Gastranaerophilales bacterium]